MQSCPIPQRRYPLLVTTADHALLDPAMIADFCAKADGADVAIGLVEQRSLMARLPSTQRTWLKFRGGAYSGANLFAFGSRRMPPKRSRCGGRSSRIERRAGG